MKRGDTNLHALIGIDKASGMTSHDVVDTLRTATGERRVGHAGTLDPFATGVLVCGIGQATRLMDRLSSAKKTYIASICFGRQTSTDDLEGETIFSGEVPSELFDPEFAQLTMASLVGEHMQLPPMFAAISVKGKRAYELAREGKEVELQERKIAIYRSELIAVLPEQNPVWTVELEVSKGTYIRSIARDLGKRFGCGAHLCGLKRSLSGSISLNQCISLTELEASSASDLSHFLLDPCSATSLKRVLVSVQEREDAQNGKALLLSDRLDELADEEEFCLVEGRRLYGIWTKKGEFARPKVNFPAGIEGVREW